MPNTSKKALIDEKFVTLVSKYSWHLHPAGYAMAKVNKKTVYLHRLILKAKEGQQVDHKNSDGLDNRLCNLRLCTYSQNNSHVGKKPRNSSGYKGVSWSKKLRKWRAQIAHNKKYYHLGYFNSKLCAANEYDKAAKKYHGEFAYLNN